MTLMLSRWITTAHVDRLVLSFYVVLTMGVFSFLAFIILLH